MVNNKMHKVISVMMILNIFIAGVKGTDQWLLGLLEGPENPHRGRYDLR